jgi:hypothetical protein
MKPGPILTDDSLTVVSISILVYILGDLLHEGLGHGVTAWLSGAHSITISTVAMQTEIDTRWIDASGTLVNLAAAGILWLVLAAARHARPVARYFLVLALAGNLFGGTGYFLFSGVSGFGDWAAVIHGLRPYWAWRLGLCVLGAASYYAAMLVVAAELKSFRGRDRTVARLRNLCWTPYFSEGILAGIAGLLNPAGLFYVVASALPSTLGANSGLLSLPFLPGLRRVRSGEFAGPIERSPAWVAAGAIGALLFIGVLGRGITWTR